MKLEDSKKDIIKNTLYTIGGALVLNGVLQLFVYPKLTSEIGSAQMGNIIYIMGLINILGPSVGQALNTSRLVVRRDHKVENGDTNLLLLLLAVIGSVVIYILSADIAGGALGAVLMFLCSILTTLRFYGDVEYRISLNYKKYFVYYLAASVGYIAGYLLYRLFGIWYWTFIAGEVFAIIYVTVTGSIFKNTFKRGPEFGIVMIKGITLVGSYFLTNLTLNVDKIGLKMLIGSEAVTEYYVASLIGKTLVLLIAPINTIIISYLTKDKKKLSKTQFYKFAGIGTAVSAFFFLACLIVNPIFIKLFYPTMIESVNHILIVVNITQILSMLSAYLFIVVLTFTAEKWQLILQGAHLVILVILIILMTKSNGIVGFSYAVLIANTIRIIAVLALGTISMLKQNNPKK